MSFLDYIVPQYEVIDRDIYLTLEDVKNIIFAAEAEINIYYATGNITESIEHKQDATQYIKNIYWQNYFSSYSLPSIEDFEGYTSWLTTHKMFDTQINFEKFLNTIRKYWLTLLRTSTTIDGQTFIIFYPKEIYTIYSV